MLERDRPQWRCRFAAMASRVLPFVLMVGCAGPDPSWGLWSAGLRVLPDWSPPQEEGAGSDRVGFDATFTPYVPPTITLSITGDGQGTALTSLELSIDLGAYVTLPEISWWPVWEVLFGWWSTGERRGTVSGVRMGIAFDPHALAGCQKIEEHDMRVILEFGWHMYVAEDPNRKRQSECACAALMWGMAF